MGDDTQIQNLYLEYVDEFGEVETKLFENIMFYNVSESFFQISLANGENYGYRTDFVLTFKTYITTKE